MVKKLLFLTILITSLNLYSQNEFITIWQTDMHSQTTAGLSNTNEIKLPVVINDDSYDYSYQPVDNLFNSTGPYSQPVTIAANAGIQIITFPTPSKYRLKITTNSTEFATNFEFGTGNSQYLNLDSRKLLRIEQWGNINWKTMLKAFAYCKNLDITATDIPNLSNVNTLEFMFFECTNLVFNPSISNWDISAVTSLKDTFNGCALFNQPVNSWNTSNVTNLSGTFQSCPTFNQFVFNWDTSRVTTMDRTFHFCSSFKENVSTWNTSNVTTFSHMFCGCSLFSSVVNTWSTGQSTEFDFMFRDAYNFNSEVSNFDVRKGKYCEGMFYNAQKFNKSLANLKFEKAINLEHLIFNTAIDCDNYSNTLIAWGNLNIITQGANNTQNPILFAEVDRMYYNPQAALARDILIAKNWTFRGDILVNNCSLGISDFSPIKVTVYPNPVIDYAYIENIDVESIRVYDINGKKVAHEVNAEKINLSHLVNATYQIVITDKNHKTYNYKIIKK